METITHSDGRTCVFSPGYNNYHKKNDTDRDVIQNNDFVGVLPCSPRLRLHRAFAHNFKAATFLI